MKFKIKILISIILICFFTAYNLFPAFAEQEIREGKVNIRATVLTGGTIIPVNPPIVGPGGEYPDFPGEEPKEQKESELPIAIKINNDNSYTNSADVILSLAAKNAVQVAISNSMDFKSASWEDFSDLEANLPNEGFTRAEKPWTLIDGNPTAPYGVIRTVYAKFRSAAGGVSGIVSDSIILDIVAPPNVSDFTAEGFAHPNPLPTGQAGSQEWNIQEGNITSTGNGSEENPLLRGVSEGRGVFLTWNNPTEKDFSKVKIFRSEKFYPMEPIAGGELSAELIYEGNGSSYLDVNDILRQAQDDNKAQDDNNNVMVSLSNHNDGTRYYYAIFAFDLAGNNSSGAIASAVAGYGEEGEISETPEYPAHLPSPKIVYKLKLSDISFFANGEEIFFDKNGWITFFAGDKIKISISAEKFPKDLKTIFVTITGVNANGSSYSSSYILKINSRKTAYEAEITVPQNSGDYAFSLAVMNFKEGTLEKLAGKVLAKEHSGAVSFQGGLEDSYEYLEKNWDVLGIFAVFSLMILVLIGFITKKVYKIIR